MKTSTCAGAVLGVDETNGPEVGWGVWGYVLGAMARTLVHVMFLVRLRHVGRLVILERKLLDNECVCIN